MNVSLDALTPQANPIAPAPAADPASRPVSEPRTTIPESPGSTPAPAAPSLELETALDIRIRLTFAEGSGHLRFKAVKKAVKELGKALRRQLDEEARRLGLGEEERKALKSVGKKLAKMLEKAVKAAFRGKVEHDGDEDDAAPAALARAFRKVSAALAEAADRLAPEADAPAAEPEAAPLQAAPAEPLPVAPADGTPAGAPVPAAPDPLAPAASTSGPDEVPAETPAPVGDPFAARLGELLGRFLDRLRSLLEPAVADRAETPAPSPPAPPAYASFEVAVGFYARVSVTGSASAGAGLDQAV